MGRKAGLYGCEVCLSYASVGATKLRRHLSAQMDSKNVKKTRWKKRKFELGLTSRDPGIRYKIVTAYIMRRNQKRAIQ